MAKLYYNEFDSSLFVYYLQISYLHYGCGYTHRVLSKLGLRSDVPCTDEGKQQEYLKSSGGPI